MRLDPENRSAMKAGICERRANRLYSCEDLMRLRQQIGRV